MKDNLIIAAGALIVATALTLFMPELSGPIVPLSESSCSECGGVIRGDDSQREWTCYHCAKLVRRLNSEAVPLR